MSQETLENFVDHVANGCCQAFMRLDRHDWYFAKYVAIESLRQLAQRDLDLPDSFHKQVEKIKDDFKNQPPQNFSGVNEAGK